MSQLYRLKDLLPNYYDEVFEMQKLVEVEQPVLDELEVALERAQTNQFAVIADDEGLSVFENMLGITPLAGTDLETRRYNVLMELLPPRPLTEKYLKQVIELLNINATLNVDGPHFRADVVSTPTDKGSTERLTMLLNKYLPANLIFTHRLQVVNHLYRATAVQRRGLRIARTEG